MKSETKKKHYTTGLVTVRENNKSELFRREKAMADMKARKRKRKFAIGFTIALIVIAVLVIAANYL